MGGEKGGDGIERPKCCGECSRFMQFKGDSPHMGWCDEWIGYHLRDTDVCHPNIGRLKRNGGEAGDGKGIRSGG